MDILDVEFVLDLPPDVVEDVFPLLIGTVVETGFKVDGLGFTLCQVNLLDAATRADEQVLAVLGGHHGATTHALEHDFGLVLAQVVFPQVHAAFEGRLVVQCVTAIGKDGTTQV